MRRLSAEALAMADSYNSSLMKFVYLIKSESHMNKTYVGVTSNLTKRLARHNDGGSVHTSKFKPWKLLTYVAFSEDSKALAFEAYLKTGSGRAFAKKRLW